MVFASNRAHYTGATRETGTPDLDIWIVNADGTNLQTVATGAAFRGAPDWGAAGVVFVETDAAVGESRLVLVAPDGSGRKVLRAEPAAHRMSAPRFLPAR